MRLRTTFYMYEGSHTVKDVFLIDTKRIKRKAGSYFSEMLFSLVQEESHTPLEQSSGLSGPSHSVAARRGAPCVGEKVIAGDKGFAGDGEKNTVQGVDRAESYCSEWNTELLQGVYRMLRNGRNAESLQGEDRINAKL